MTALLAYVSAHPVWTFIWLNVGGFWLASAAYAFSLGRKR